MQITVKRGKENQAKAVIVVGERAVYGTDSLLNAVFGEGVVKSQGALLFDTAEPGEYELSCDGAVFWKGEIKRNTLTHFKPACQWVKYELPKIIEAFNKSPDLVVITVPDPERGQL